MERLGCRLRSAASADDAIEALARDTGAVALCGSRMPGKNEIWLAAQIRGRFAGVAIVLVTGLHAMDVVFTLRPGIVGSVTKPSSAMPPQEPSGRHWSGT